MFSTNFLFKKFCLKHRFFILNVYGFIGLYLSNGVGTEILWNKKCLFMFLSHLMFYSFCFKCLHLILKKFFFHIFASVGLYLSNGVCTEIYKIRNVCLWFWHILCLIVSNVFISYWRIVCHILASIGLYLSDGGL